MKYNITIIIPCYNEEQNIDPLYKKIVQSITNSKKIKNYKIIYINDGSSDNTKKKIEKVTKKDKNVSIISFDKRQGKSNALQKGFDNVSVDTNLVFMMDGDLQDDPKEFNRFIEKIEDGYDVVSGYKKKRFDNIEKRLASKLYNTIINLLFKTAVHDSNCGFKCFKYEVIKNIYIYDNLHRFLIVIAKSKGYRISEIEVEHHKRVHGKSKYGLARYFVGFKDIIRMKYILSIKHIKLNILINLFMLILLVVLSIKVSLFFILAIVIYLTLYIWLLFNYYKYYKVESN